MIRARLFDRLEHRYLLATVEFGRNDPLPISDFASYAYSITSTAPAGALITSAEFDFRVSHTWPGDLRIFINSPQGTQRVMWDRSGGSDDGGLDDDAATDDDVYFDRINVSTWNGQRADGVWTLGVEDWAAGDTGTVDWFYMRLTYEVPLPNLKPAIDALNEPWKWGQSSGFNLSVNNAGLGIAGASSARLILSSNSTINDSDDITINTFSIPALMPGNAWGLSYAYTPPATPPPGYPADGPVYFAFRADSGNVITESNETDNLLADIVTMSLPRADLIPSFDALSEPFEWGAHEGFEIGIRNQGDARSNGGTARLVMSSNGTIGDSDDVLLNSFNVPPLLPGETWGLTHLQGLPMIPPPGYPGAGSITFALLADATGTTAESNEINNVSSDIVQIARPFAVSGVRVGNIVDIDDDGFARSLSIALDVVGPSARATRVELIAYNAYVEQTVLSTVITLPGSVGTATVTASLDATDLGWTREQLWFDVRLTDVQNNAQTVVYSNVDFPQLGGITVEPSARDPVTTGITTLLHGFKLSGGGLLGGFDPIDDYWGVDNITALLSAYEGGRVYVYDPDDGLLYRDNRTAFAHWDDPFGQIIVVHDWAAASNDSVSGQAEASADALFASLVHAGLVTPREPSLSDSFHLIGHSRGTVVASELAQRMGVYGIPVDYMTLLDVHDFDEGDVPFDGSFHDPGPQPWSNIMLMDHVWQVAGLPVVPSGRNLPFLVDSESFDLDITGYPGVSGTDAHSDPINWYFGTVDPGSEDSGWYSDGRGADMGLTRWLDRGGFDFDGAIHGFVGSRVDPINPANAYRFPGGANDLDDHMARTDFSMGDFDLEELGNDALAGWSFHGGGGGGSVVQGRLRLSPPTLFDWDPHYRTHNRLYLPHDTDSIVMDVDVLDGSSAGNVLRISATDHTGTQVLDSLPIPSYPTGYTASIEIPESLRGRMTTIRFELIGSSIDSSVALDNIRFDRIPPNAPPIAFPDAVTVQQNADFTPLNVLANDVDPEQELLTIVQVTTPVHGQVFIDNNILFYRPNPGYLGSDTFNYTVADDMGLTSTASVELTVVDLAPPTVTSFKINDGGLQRSNLTKLVLQFNEATNIPELIASASISSAVQLVLASTGSVLSWLNASRYAWNADRFELTVDLTTDGFGGSNATRLSTARYTLRIDRSMVKDLSDNLLQDTDGNADNTVVFKRTTGSTKDDLFRLAGDANGSGRVDSFDQLLVRQNWYLTVATGMNPDADLNGDGIVNASDLLMIKQNGFRTLPTLSSESSE